MGTLLISHRRFFAVLLFIFAGTRSAVAQTATLSLASAAIAPGSTATLNLSLSGSAGPASLQWTLNYPTSSVSAFSVNAGAALAAAGKTLSCYQGAGNY